MRLGSQAPLTEMYASLSTLVAARDAGSQQAEFEEFVDLVRAQVAAMESTKGWIRTQVNNAVMASAQTCLAPSHQVLPVNLY